MSKKCSISDYPEHLNPFYEGYEKPTFWKSGKVKRSNSFGAAIRNSFLFKSLRPKKKEPPRHEPVAIRTHVQSQTNLPLQRQTLPLLPRSRFSERVAHLNDIPNGALIETKDNPFERSVQIKRSRRRKKRAPLPPGVAVNVNSYKKASSEHNLSEWSLTSVGTDLSAYSENEDMDHVKREIHEIMNITEELQKMTELVDNNESEDSYDFISQILGEIIDHQIYIKQENFENETHTESLGQTQIIHDTSSEENMTFNQQQLISSNTEKGPTVYD